MRIKAGMELTIGTVATVERTLGIGERATIVRDDGELLELTRDWDDEDIEDDFDARWIDENGVVAKLRPRGAIVEVDGDCLEAVWPAGDGTARLEADGLTTHDIETLLEAITSLAGGRVHLIGGAP